MGTYNTGTHWDESSYLILLFADHCYSMEHWTTSTYDPGLTFLAFRVGNFKEGNEAFNGYNYLNLTDWGNTNLFYLCIQPNEYVGHATRGGWVFYQWWNTWWLERDHSSIRGDMLGFCLWNHERDGHKLFGYRILPIWIQTDNKSNRFGVFYAISKVTSFWIGIGVNAYPQHNSNVFLTRNLLSIIKYFCRLEILLSIDTVVDYQRLC